MSDPYAEIRKLAEVWAHPNWDPDSVRSTLARFVLAALPVVEAARNVDRAVFDVLDIYARNIDEYHDELREALAHLEEVTRNGSS